MLNAARLVFLMISLCFGTQAFALPKAIEPTPVQGQISQIVYGALGKPTGIILIDHTLLEFPPGSLVDPTILRPGDAISASGVQVLSAPNRVFDRVALQKGGITLFDNSSVAANPEDFVVPAGFVSNFKEMAAAAPLVAVAATPDGEVSSLVLEDGSNVQIPSGAYVNPMSLHLGEVISASGAGKVFSPPGAFLHAQLVRTVNGRELIQARGYDREKWILKQGTIKQALVTPRGQTDGFLLTDKWAIRFPPVPSDEVAQLTPGTKVSVAGPGARNQIGADSLIVLTNNTPGSFVSLAPSSGNYEAAGMQGQLAGRIPTPGLIPMQDVGNVVAIFSNSRGEIDTVVLDDGTRVWVPPRLRKTLPKMKEGLRVSVKGTGGTYALGTSLIADDIKNVA